MTLHFIPQGTHPPKPSCTFSWVNSKCLYSSPGLSWAQSLLIQMSSKQLPKSISYSLIQLNFNSVSFYHKEALQNSRCRFTSLNKLEVTVAWLNSLTTLERTLERNQSQRGTHLLNNTWNCCFMGYFLIYYPLSLVKRNTLWQVLGLLCKRTYRICKRFSSLFSFTNFHENSQCNMQRNNKNIYK